MTEQVPWLKRRVELLMVKICSMGKVGDDLGNLK
jgi:hypothetical protein